MSLISKLMTLAAAGGKGSEHWVAKIFPDPNTTNSFRSPLTKVMSDGSIAFCSRGFGSFSNRTAVARFSAQGAVDWVKLITPNDSANDDVNYGMCVDPSDNIFVGSDTDVDNNGEVYKYSALGTLLEQNKFNTWRDDGPVQPMSADSGQLYYGKRTSGGSYIFGVDSTGLLGTSNWSLSPQIDGTHTTTDIFTLGTNVYMGHYANISSSGARASILELNKTTGAVVAFKGFELQGQTYNGVNSNGQNRFTTDGSHFYINMATDFAAHVGVVKATTGYASVWGRRMTHPSGIMQGGGVTVDSLGNVYSANVFQGTSASAGIYITKFNSSGTFVDELFIRVDNPQPLSSIELDPEENIVLCLNVIFTQLRPCIFKLPLDYSALSGTVGDFTFSYSTTSTLSITSPTVGVSNMSPTVYNTSGINTFNSTGGVSTSDSLSVTLSAV